MKQKEFFGLGSIDNLGGILKSENIRNVFLVTGKNSFESSGAKRKLDGIFKKANCTYTKFSDFTPNPQIEEINRGYVLSEKQKYDAIIAVGGGSAIDVAKTIKMFTSYKSDTLPLIAIPTTAGSGSEATYFIVYYSGKEKISQGQPELTLPDYTICDPQFLISLPKPVAASTGIDALGQAIESYWSIDSTQQSKKFAKQAIQLLMGNLESSIKTPSLDTKERVMRATNLAGKAINISETTASHSVAYPLSSYFQIPHGHAVGLILGEMLVYNSEVTKQDCLDKRGADYAKRTIRELVGLVETRTPQEASNRITGLMQEIGLETRLSELGLEKQDIETILQHGFNPERVENNPRLLTEKALKNILNRLY